MVKKITLFELFSHLSHKYRTRVLVIYVQRTCDWDTLQNRVSLVKYEFHHFLLTKLGTL